VSQRDPSKTTHVYRNMEMGVDSGKSPSIILPNQIAFGINTTMRGGFPSNRPGFRKLGLTGDSLPTGVFQGATFFSPVNGADASIALQVGGRQFLVTPDDYSARAGGVREITIDGDPNSSVLRQCWMVQAEDFLIIQDGQSRAFIYDGSTARRSNLEGNEVPTGTRMAYGNGRVWVSKSRFFVAGDLVGGASGTVPYERRDAVLKFTENSYLAGGGQFGVQMQSGEITGLKFISNLDTSLGEGQLIVFTRHAVYAVNVPADRTEWQDLQNPVQRVALLSYGARGQNAIENVNSDIFFRADDGIRSMIFARRNFSDWGQVPVSREMNRVLTTDDRNLLGYGSAVIFDNRLLMTCSPVNLNEYGVYHRGLIALDFDLISSMYAKSSPAYDGLWTGLNVLQIVKGSFGDLERCFLIVLNASNAIEIWEVSTGDYCDRPDFDESTPIEWQVEYGSGLFSDFGQELKLLRCGDIWLDNITGDVTIAAQFRPDQYPQWNDWHEWTISASLGCAVGCSPALFPLRQYRTRRRLPQPPDSDESTDNKPMRYGYEFQPKLTITGACRVKMLRLHADKQPEFVDGDCPDNENETSLNGCSDDPFTYRCEP
jgi:hypothetical protein